jgi:hypothetical protein
MRAVVGVIWSVISAQSTLQNPAFSQRLFDIQRHLLLQPAFYCDKVTSFVIACRLFFHGFFASDIWFTRFKLTDIGAEN